MENVGEERRHLGAQAAPDRTQLQADDRGLCEVMGSRRSFLSTKEVVVTLGRESPMGTTLTSASSAVPP